MLDIHITIVEPADDSTEGINKVFAFKINSEVPQDAIALQPVRPLSSDDKDTLVSLRDDLIQLLAS